MISPFNMQSVAALFSLQTAAPVFAFLATQEVLYRLFEKAVSHYYFKNPQHKTAFSPLKGRMGACAIAGGLIAGASIVLPSSTLYLAMGTISCLGLLALRLTRPALTVAPPAPPPGV